MANSNIAQTKDDKNKTSTELLILDSSILTTLESVPGNIKPINKTQENHESVVFIWFDPDEQSSLNLVGPLRVINDNVQSFNDSLSCFNAIKSSKDKIFFITSSINNELIATIHNYTSIEAIFILNPNIEIIKGDFPKLFGIFNQQEELFRVLKEIFDLFEQIQLETFAFEHDKEFIWTQLWKEELTTRKMSSRKHIFIEATRQYYRDNMIIIRLIDELDKSYRPNEVLSWCFRSPFPSRFIHHGLRSHNKEQLSVCRFLFTDASRFFQQHQKRKTSDQVYRGMKLSNELINKFESHVGQLISTSGFFPCTKSRTNALTLASLPAYRSELLPVLFKIDCDTSALYFELTNKSSLPLIIFDISMAFRIVYVNRGQMTIIKMKTDGENGRKIALDYLGKHKDETIQSLLDELMRPPPPPPPKVTPPSNQARKSIHSAEEIKAQRCVEKGDIDRAMAIYQHIQPVNARVLNIMGQLSAERKGDYKYAVQCHTKALKIQEETGEDIAETLTDLGNAYHNCNEYDLALGCHTRALSLRHSNQSNDNASIATNLVGIANAHWARREYPQAIDNAQRALTLRENIKPMNESSVAATLAMLSNIYQDYGNIHLALDLSKRALIFFERTLSSDSPILAELLYNLGTMQLNAELLEDAYQSFERVAKIYRKILPQQHPDRLAAEKDLKHVIQLYQTKRKSSQYYS